MDISIQWTFLPHTDPEASLAFYRDALGFEVRSDVGGGTQRWITIGAPSQPGVSVVLHPPAADLSDAEREAVTAMMARGAYATIVLGTSDLDAAFARIKETGAEVAQEPADQPWGVRDCAFRDPAGNQVRLNQK